MTEPKNPIQPLVTDDKGIVRFKPNKLVQYLLDKGGLTLNDLPYHDCSRSDCEQLAMLIGYSVSGFSSLSYVSDETYEAVTRIQQQGLSEEAAKIAALEDILSDVRRGMRLGAARLYGKHPSDFGEDEDDE